jgi:acetyl esterase/lipase
MTEFVHGTSLRSRALAAAMPFTFRPFADFWPFHPVALRALGLATDTLARAGRLPPGTSIESVDDGRVRGELVDATGGTQDRVLLYLHGGGFVFCSPRTHRMLVAGLGRAAGAQAFGVEYRHPPRHPIAAAVDDSVEAYAWLLDRGWAPHQVVVAGDSAGGNLAFATCVGARERGLPQPAGILALSPWVDLAIDAEAPARREVSDPMMSLRFATRCAAVCAAGSQEALAVVSPLEADLTGLPPVLIQVGSTELLYDGSERMAQRLRAAGVPCRLQAWERQVHVFQAFSALVPEAHAALLEAGEFVRSSTAPRLRAAA